MDRARGIAPAMPGGGSAGVKPAELDWLQYPPQHAITIDRTESTLVKVGALSSATVIAIDVPDDSVLRISGIGFGAMSQTALAMASFKLLRNGETLGDYYDVPCISGSLARPGRIDLFVHGPATFRIDVYNNFPLSAFRYIARVMGWVVQKVR